MSDQSYSLKGYTLPLTPAGDSSLVDAPPWYYGGELMQLFFRADPAKARAFIPTPLEMGPDPGAGIVWFVEWISVSESHPEMAYENPERAIYKECIVLLQCSYQGGTGYLVPFIWVDNDFTLVRGFIQGFPKVLGRISMTKLHPLNPKIGGRRPGAKLKGICEAAGERLVEGSLLLTEKAEKTQLPKVKFFLLRHFPDIENPEVPIVHEIATSISSLEVDDVWRGKADVKFSGVFARELQQLAPVSVADGFYHSAGLTIHGGRVLHRYVHPRKV